MLWIVSWRRGNPESHIKVVNRLQDGREGLEFLPCFSMTFLYDGHESPQQARISLQAHEPSVLRTQGVVYETVKSEKT